MRYVSLGEAVPGMVLGQDLFDSFGRVLIGKHNLLSQEYIEKLEEYGFYGVYITDELSQDIEIEPLISPKLRAEGQECIRTSDIDSCMSIAKDIVKEILEHGKLSLDMTDLRSYDDYTYAHSVNVAVISSVIGLGMKMGEEDLELLVTAALLHDLGKLSIPSEILNKPGRLTPKEYEIMKSHSTKSYELISERWDISSLVKSAVLLHHENVDGTGYPQGIDGENQTIFIKVLHVADVYDALVSKRPYKNPYSPFEASEYLMGGCDILFDREVVETLLKYVPLYPKGTEVLLSDGNRAIIVDNSGIHNLRPVVRTFSGQLMDLTSPQYLSVTLNPVEVEYEHFTEESELRRKEMMRPVIRPKVVVVDDMVTNLQMLRTILEEDYDLTLLKSGYQLMSYLKTHEAPALILMDIDMPGMTGIEAAKQVPEVAKKKIPILFVSALCDKETVMACRALDAAGYIVRPYKPVYIKAEMKRILNRRSVYE